MKLAKTPILLFYFFISINSYGQKKLDILYKENIATEFFKKNDFTQSLELYLELDSINPKGDYNFPIAISYMNLNNHSKALFYFEECLKSEKQYPFSIYYYLGKAYHLSHEFDKAISSFELFKTKLLEKKSGKNSKVIQESIVETDRELEICRYAKQLISHPLDIKITNLGPVINSEYPDYGAILSADENQIVFTSNRPGTTGGQIDQSDGMGLHFEDIYISRKTNEGWSVPQSIGEPVNSSGNDASVSLTADGQKLFFYRSSRENFVSANSGDLYISSLKGDKWLDPVKLPDVINSKGWEPSASISADERVLFFASNREKGLGGTDLYMVKLLPNGQWAMPRNLGPKINTPYDEDSPFIHPDGKTLYFSSKGHKTMGGFDVFVTRLNEETNEWSEPENVGYPINTAQDDIHFTWSADGKRVYFSTIRPEGYGDKDIYYAEMEAKEVPLVVLKGNVLDSASLQPIEATILVTEKETDELIGIFNSNGQTGKYLVVLPEGKEYKISISAEKYKDRIDFLHLPQSGMFEMLEKDIKLLGRPSK